MAAGRYEAALQAASGLYAAALTLDYLSLEGEALSTRQNCTVWRHPL